MSFVPLIAPTTSEERVAERGRAQAMHSSIA